MVADGGVDQELAAQRRPALVADAEGRYRREVAARAVAGQRDPHRVAANLRGMLRHPARRGQGVVGRGGEGVLRREPVAHRYDHAAGAGAERPADRVVGVEVAEHPTTAVEEDHERERSPALGGVDAHRQIAGRAGDDPILDRRYGCRDQPHPEQRRHLGGRFPAHHLDRNGADRRRVGR